jgi:hypothetical protein
MIQPNEPTGSGALAEWCRRLLRWCRSLEVQSGIGYKVRRSSSGTVLEIGPSNGGAGGPGRYRVKSVQGDYLTCHTWDGTTENTLTDLYIAKSPHLRHSLSAQTIGTNAVTYSGYAISAQYVCTRNAVGTSTQAEMVLPTWQTGTLSDSEIWADTPPLGTGVTTTAAAVVTLMDTNRDARAWCQT